MSNDDNTAPLRVGLGYQDVDTFIERFAPNVSAGGVFIASKTPRPEGATFRFEIALAGGPVVLSGEGRVAWVHAFDPEAPRKPHGMGVQFVSIDEATRPILEQLVAHHEDAKRERRRSARPARPRRSTVRAEPPLAVMARVGAGGALPGTNGQDEGRVNLGDLDAGVSEESIMRAMDYARELGEGAGRDDVEALLNAEPVPGPGAATVESAMRGLSQMLRPRRQSGLYRLPPELLKKSNRD